MTQTEIPTFRTLRAPMLFERAAHGLAQGVVAPEHAVPGDIIGLDIEIAAEETGLLSARAPRRYLVAGGPAPRWVRFSDLLEAMRPRAALVSAWLHDADIGSGWEIDWSKGRTGILTRKTYSLTLMPQLGLIRRRLGDRGPVETRMYRGMLQEALDCEWMLALPEPTSAHRKLDLARHFTPAGHAAYEATLAACLRSVAEEVDGPSPTDAQLPPLHDLITPAE